MNPNEAEAKLRAHLAMLKLKRDTGVLSFSEESFNQEMAAMTALALPDACSGLSPAKRLEMSMYIHRFIHENALLNFIEKLMRIDKKHKLGITPEMATVLLHVGTNAQRDAEREFDKLQPLLGGTILPHLESYLKRTDTCISINEI